jgi:hypothetical protein
MDTAGGRATKGVISNTAACVSLTSPRVLIVFTAGGVTTVTRNVQTTAASHTVHNIQASAESVMKATTVHIVKEHVTPPVERVRITVLVKPAKRDFMVKIVNRDALIIVKTVKLMANVGHVLMDILEKTVDVNYHSVQIQQMILVLVVRMKQHGTLSKKDVVHVVIIVIQHLVRIFVTVMAASMVAKAVTLATIAHNRAVYIVQVAIKKNAIMKVENA